MGVGVQRTGVDARSSCATPSIPLGIEGEEASVLMPHPSASSSSNRGQPSEVMGAHTPFVVSWQAFRLSPSHLGCRSGIRGGIMGAGSEHGNLGELGAGHRKSMYSVESLTTAGFIVQGMEL